MKSTKVNYSLNDSTDFGSLCAILSIVCCILVKCLLALFGILLFPIRAMGCKLKCNYIKAWRRCLTGSTDACNLSALSIVESMGSEVTI